MPSLTPQAQHLAQAGQALRKQLRQLDGYAPAPGQPLALAGLLTALDEYEAAVLASMAPLPTWPLNPVPTPTELRAEREACPLYRLGWVRGYEAGQAAGQWRAEPALLAYAHHAALPLPTDPSALIGQVRRFLAQLQLQRRAGGAGLTAADLPPLTRAA